MTSNPDLVGLAGRIVAAYAAGNHLPASGLPELIQTTHAALTTIALAEAEPPAAPAAEAIERPSSAQIRKSVSPDAIISFVDGKAYKTLKRHLGTHGLTPLAYRQRYGLPADYPMVAPNYAAQRSALAKAIGLGQPGAQAGKAAPAGKRLAAA